MAYKIVNTVTTVVEKIETKEVEVSLVQYIGLKAKHYRETLGLKQIDVARKTVDDKGVPAISAAFVSYLEGGTGNPGLNALETLAEVLGIHISELFPQKTILPINTPENEQS